MISEVEFIFRLEEHLGVVLVSSLFTTARPTAASLKFFRLDL